MGVIPGGTPLPLLPLSTSVPPPLPRGWHFSSLTEETYDWLSLNPLALETTDLREDLKISLEGLR